MHLLFFTLFLWGFLAGQRLEDQLYFDHYSDVDGLSQVSVNSIVQDQKGFLWFGTQNGLNRFDGLEFRVFKKISGDTSSLSHNLVSALFCDSKNRIWVGTVVGTISVYEYQSNSFRQIDFDSLKPGRIRKFVEDKSGRIWFSSTKHLLRVDRGEWHAKAMRLINSDRLFNISTLEIVDNEIWLGIGRFGVYRYDPDKPFDLINSGFPDYLKSTRVNDIVRDEDGDIFFSTLESGFIHYSKKTGTYKHYQQDNSSNRLSSNTITSLLRDGDYLWLASYNGLNRMNLENHVIDQFPYMVGSKNGVSDDYILAMLNDKNNDLWLGTSLGISKLNRKKSVFKHLAYNPLYPNVLRRPIVWSVIADDDDIWFTDISMGLNRYRRSSGKVEKYLDQMDFPENMKQVKEIYFTSFVPDGDSGFWIGTSGRGIIHFWPETGKMERFFSRNVKLKADFTTCLLLDKSYLWIGSYFGLERMNLTDGTIDFFQTAEVIQSMKFDRQGYIWLSCRAGLYYFDTTQFRVSDRYSEINALLPDKNVTATQFDKNGVLWIGTQAGLSAYDLNSSKFTTYTEANGLPDNMIYTILLDDKNDLWLSTNHGISHFIQNEQRFVNYDKSDGLPANEFNSNAAFIDTDNTLYFGSINGLLSFNPSGLMEKNPPPAVEITALNVFDKSINFRQTNPELDYTQNYLTFQFAALDFVNPERNSFRYRLDGFETEWTLSSRPFAIYPKLPAGDYTFRVKAANSGGVWNEDGASLQFVILHPWWEQNWFYLTVLIVIILTLWMIHRQRLQSAKKREIELERIIQERTIEIDRQARELKLLDRMKSKFFTNISHEFRTPLTLIIGPLEELQEKTTDNRMQSTYQRMIFNAKRLLRLINELLELSRLELGKNQLNTEQVDLVEHTNYIINSFLSFTEYKQIDFSFVADTQSYRCEIDIEKYEMILSNLLGNAIKYTDSHGKIKTEFKHDKNGISIQVIDNGIGINAADLPHIFDRFYQSDNIDSSIEGSGIGLSVVRELLQLMGGDIKVESQPGNGACFTINLPLKKLGKPATIAIEAYDSPVDHAHDNGKPLLLIAEDHPQLLDYISEQFKHSYSLLRCSNGREALLQAREMIPDLIISDLMMPEMDGMQLAKEIRLDSKTNHIPFIMLTAKAEESEKLKSLAIGIDDFIIKPFKQSELLARVQNLLEQRQRLKNRYQDQFILDTDNLNMESIDQQFIRSVLTQCESALADSAFTVERLADQLSMSRKQLHRKLTAILNISPNRLIRILRLKKARLMIENKHAAVSEIAYAVGFESLSYFSKCYKDEFGYLPSEFQS